MDKPAGLTGGLAGICKGHVTGGAEAHLLALAVPLEIEKPAPGAGGIHDQIEAVAIVVPAGLGGRDRTG